MDLKIYYGNKARSVELYNRNKEVVERKYCYNNVFNIMNYDDEVFQKIIKGEWKIAYCYFKVFDDKNVYVRHACFLDVLSNEMIDPTITPLSTFKTRQRLEYRLLHAFDYEEYMEAINTYHNEPALTEYLSIENERLRTQMLTDGLIAID